MNGKLPPHDSELELMCIGSLLAETEDAMISYPDILATGIIPADFFDPRARDLYTRLITAWNDCQGKRPIRDIIPVGDKSLTDYALRAAANGVPALAPGFAAQVHNLGRRRAAIEAAQIIAQEAYEGKPDWQHRVSAIADTLHQGKPATADTSLSWGLVDG